MKKLFAFLLILSMALPILTACVPEEWETPESTAPIPMGTETAGTVPDVVVTPEDGDDEDYDPTKDEYGFTLFADGNYITDEKFDTDDYLPDYDANYSFKPSVSAASDDDRVYYTSANSKTIKERKTYIMYEDKATGVTGLLCADPDCAHDGGSCTAYISSGTPEISSFAVCDGAVYYVTGNTISRVETDGTDKVCVKTVSRSDIDFDWGSVSSVIHRGYAYFCGTKTSKKDGKDIVTVTVAAVPLGGEEEAFTVFSKTYAAASIVGSSPATLRCVGRNVYIMLILGSSQNNMELYRWSTKTRTAEQVCTSKESFAPAPNTCFLPVSDGIYFMTLKSANRTYKYGVCKYSYETKTFGEIFYPEYDGKAYDVYYITEEYFLACRNNLIYVFDHEGNFIFHTESLNGVFSFDGAEELFPAYVENPLNPGATLTVAGADSDRVYGYITASTWNDIGDGAYSLSYKNEFIASIPYDGSPIGELIFERYRT